MFCIDIAAKIERLKFIFCAANPEIRPHNKSPEPAIAKLFDALSLIHILPFGVEIIESLPLYNTVLQIELEAWKQSNNLLSVNLKILLNY